MIAREIMKKKFLTVDKDPSVEDAMRIMKKHNVSRLLVTEKGKVIGIITESDIAERLASGKERKIKIDHIHVSAAMKKYVRVVYPEEDVREVARQMIEYGISSLAVEEKEEIIGLITKTDLIRVLVNSTKRVCDFYTKNPIVCNPGDRLVHVRKMMVENKIHRLLVTDGGVVVGVVTDRDIARGLRTYRQALDKFHHPDLERLAVDYVMSRTPIFVKPETRIGELVGIMLDKGISGIPVACPDHGIITKTDLVRGIAEGKLP
ncbi:MAG: CBS domain-containing protein [Candidatus Altiarchaeota archaeon]